MKLNTMMQDGNVHNLNPNLCDLDLKITQGQAFLTEKKCLFHNF